MINHCKALKVDKEAIPQPYWINTSGNYIIKRFIEKANQQTRREIEQLIEGKAINKEIRLELTYNELDNTIENLWSVLFATGYLTQQGKPQRKNLFFNNSKRIYPSDLHRTDPGMVQRNDKKR